MTTTVTSPAFIEQLSVAATEAQRAESTFRDSFAREIARHERARQFAYRRLDIARTMTSAARSAEDANAAVAAQTKALKSEFGWYGDTARNRQISEAWRPVALAIWSSVAPGASDRSTVVDVPAAMLAFEAWYENAFGQNYLVILDHEIPEIPVVEF